MYCQYLVNVFIFWLPRILQRRKRRFYKSLSLFNTLFRPTSALYRIISLYSFTCTKLTYGQQCTHSGVNAVWCSVSSCTLLWAGGSTEMYNLLVTGFTLLPYKTLSVSQRKRYSADCAFINSILDLTTN